ncbi:DUF2254 domain-containing protein [Nocardioides perillae]|uniref:Putative membrane protein n=1 Tax=Nocardioides perillae TaxID=1119534 RepID=A0A7Y9RS36_9ACTN|nr:DUF2254 domain-containing protein [Nocardioides perillae]NYG53928.1 putative membrane protein [Nocardioides perillae]
MPGDVRRGRERGRWSTGGLWTWPAVAVLLGVAAARSLVEVPVPFGWPRTILWPGDVESLSALLQVLATTTITATTLTFSITVVALQLASQQFSPRLLREFTRDRVTKLVLAVLLGTFAYSITVLRELRAVDEAPAAAAFVAGVLALVSLSALIGLIAHIVTILRIDTMMLSVNGETRRAMAASYPAYDAPRDAPPVEAARPEGQGALVRAAGGGFVSAVDVARLVGAMRERRACTELLVRPGDHVVTGAPVAQVWRTADGSAPPQDEDAHDVGDAVRAAVSLGYERTLEQDVAFGFRQLEDIAVKALSPGINDPVTAAHAIGHMAELVVHLLGRRLGPVVHADDAGEPRVLMPDRDLTYFLDLACGQVRRYGSREPTVLAALLRLLRDAAAAARDDHQRAVVEAHADAVVAALDGAVADHDAAPVHDLRQRVGLALAGDVRGAYVDRAGETRSI